MALAAAGVLVALRGADDTPSDAVVVLARDVAVGEMITADHLRLDAAALPAGITGSFDSVEEPVGLVAVAPLAEGDLLQGSALSRTGRAGLHEVAITLPREQVAVGRLKRGERVDAYVTADSRTTSVVRGAEVVQIAAGDGDRPLTTERVVSLVVGVPSADDVAALVHALRTGDVTVVRSTLAEASTEVVVHPADEVPDRSADDEDGDR